MIRLTPAVKTLLLVNVIIFFAGSLLGMQDLLTHLGALVYVGSEYFRIHQFFTYMFLHAGLWHLVGNMFILFFFGPILESEWGSQRFLIYFLATGIGAGIIFAGVDYYETKKMEDNLVLYEQDPSLDNLGFLLSHSSEFQGALKYRPVVASLERLENAPEDVQYQEAMAAHMRAYYQVYENGSMVGASGAIFGIIIAMGLMFPNMQIRLLLIPVPITVKYIVIVLGSLEVYNQVQNAANDNVAHLAHLAGMLVGVILIKVWYGRDYRRR